MKEIQTWEERFDEECTFSHPGDSGLGGNTPQDPEYYINVEPEDVKSFIRSLLATQREETEKVIKDKIQEVAMSPHFPGGALERKKGFQLAVLEEVLSAITNHKE